MGLGKMIGNEISLYQIMLSRRLFLDTEAFLKQNFNKVVFFFHYNDYIIIFKVSISIYDPIMNEEDDNFLRKNFKEFILAKVI